MMESAWREKAVLAVLLVASMTTFMGGAAVAPCLPQMSLAFPEASSTAISLVITLPGLSVAVCGFFVGAFADRVGKVRTLVLATLLFTAAGYAPLVLNSLELILAARLILGVGIAGIAVSTTALIADCFSGEKLTKALALQAAAMGAGVLVLETGGGFLAELGWRSAFWMYSIGLIILLGVALFMREPKAAGAKDAEANGSAPAQGGFDVAAFSRRAILLAVGGGAFCCFLENATSFTIPGRLPFFIEEFGGSSSVSGVVLGLHGLSLTVASLVQGKLALSWKRPRLLFLSFLLIGGGLLVPGFMAGIVAAVAAGVLTGIGGGILIPTVLQWMTSVATPRTSGKITGCNTAAVNLGQFACSLLMAPVLAVTGSSEGLFVVFGVVALVLGCVVVPWIARLK